MATKIQKIKISEFKVIKDLEADINGANILVIGENEVGKSSLLQFIDIALGKGSNIPADVTGKGVVWVDRDGEPYTLSVKVSEGKSIVSIEGKNGMRDQRKATLKGLFGAMEFDINKFVELSKTTAGRKQQVELFKGLLPADFRAALSTYEQNLKIHYDERTEINKAIKDLEGSIRENKLNYLSNEALATKEEVDTKALSDELEKINSENRKVEDVQNRMEERNRRDRQLELLMSQNQAKIDALLKENMSYAEEKKQNKEKNIAAENWIKANPIKDTVNIRTQLEQAGTAAKEAYAAKELLKQRTLLAKLIEEGGEKTVLIETTRQAIADAIRDFQSPVEGLMYEGEELRYNGIPVSPDNLSTSQIIELGMRLKMAENPDIGVITIENGESIGTKRLETILSIAKEKGWQVIMEQVQRGQDKLVIELMR